MRHRPQGHTHGTALLSARPAVPTSDSPAGSSALWHRTSQPREALPFPRGDFCSLVEKAPSLTVKLHFTAKQNGVPQLISGHAAPLGLPIAPCRRQSPPAPLGRAPVLPQHRLLPFSPCSMSPGSPRPAPGRSARGGRWGSSRRSEAPSAAARGCPRPAGPTAASGPELRRAPPPAPPSARPSAARRPPAEGPGERPGGPGGRAERRGGAGRGGGSGYTSCPLRAEPGGGGGAGHGGEVSAASPPVEGRSRGQSSAGPSRAEPSRGWGQLPPPPRSPRPAPAALLARSRRVNGRFRTAAALGPRGGSGLRRAGLRGTGCGSERVSCPSEGAAAALVAGGAQPGSRGGSPGPAPGRPPPSAVVPWLPRIAPSRRRSRGREGRPESGSAGRANAAAVPAFRREGLGAVGRSCELRAPQGSSSRLAARSSLSGGEKGEPCWRAARRLGAGRWELSVFLRSVKFVCLFHFSSRSTRFRLVCRKVSLRYHASPERGCGTPAFTRSRHGVSPASARSHHRRRFLPRCWPRWGSGMQGSPFGARTP